MNKGRCIINETKLGSKKAAMIHFFPLENYYVIKALIFY